MKYLFSLMSLLFALALAGAGHAAEKESSDTSPPQESRQQSDTEEKLSPFAEMVNSVDACDN